MLLFVVLFWVDVFVVCFMVGRGLCCCLIFVLIWCIMFLVLVWWLCMSSQCGFFGICCCISSIVIVSMVLSRKQVCQFSVVFIICGLRIISDSLVFSVVLIQKLVLMMRLICLCMCVGISLLMVELMVVYLLLMLRLVMKWYSVRNRKFCVKVVVSVVVMYSISVSMKSCLCFSWLVRWLKISVFSMVLVMQSEFVQLICVVLSVSVLLCFSMLLSDLIRVIFSLFSIQVMFKVMIMCQCQCDQGRWLRWVGMVVDGVVIIEGFVCEMRCIVQFVFEWQIVCWQCGFLWMSWVVCGWGCFSYFLMGVNLFVSYYCCIVIK